MRSVSRARHLTSASLMGLSILACTVAMANGGSTRNSPSGPGNAHAHHAASGNADVQRSEAEYVIPDVTLVRDDGKSVALSAELDDGRPVALNFIYTSCTTICPLSSQVFEQFQVELGAGRDDVHLVSISIDPEQDTPARLHAYGALFHAQRGWDHYSGSLASVLAVQKAFNAYRGDKMSHSPLTLLRAGPGRPWIRLDGFARADDLMTERKSWKAAAASLVAR